MAPLWARNNTNGIVYQYLNISGPSTGKITLQPRTQIGTGYAAADYPLIFSVGDINGDDVPDLAAPTKPGNTLVDQLGAATATTAEFDGTSGKPAQIGDSSWNVIATIN